MSVAFVVGGSPEPISPERLKAVSEYTDFVLAVDKGMDICISAGLSVNVFCGDGDSLSTSSKQYLVEHPEVEKVMYNPLKDDTDLALALEEAKLRGCKRVVVASLSGGRLDHQLAVVGVLRSVEEIEVVWVEDAMVAHLLTDSQKSELLLNDTCRSKTLSCISLCDGTVVSEEGMRWNADHLTLDVLSDRGVSNVVESDAARIEVHEGKALVCINDADLSAVRL